MQEHARKPLSIPEYVRGPKYNYFLTREQRERGMGYQGSKNRLKAVLKKLEDGGTTHELNHARSHASMCARVRCTCPCGHVHSSLPWRAVCMHGMHGTPHRPRSPHVHAHSRGDTSCYIEEE